MQKGRGGMGLHKHGVSGVVPKNRRALRQLGYAKNREVKKQPPPADMKPIDELFKK